MLLKKGTMICVSKTNIKLLYKCQIYLNLHSLLVTQKVSLLDWPMVKSTALLKESEKGCLMESVLDLLRAIDSGP